MAIARISNWLNSSEKNYNDGLALFKEFSTNSFYKNLLSSGPDEYNSPKLQELLFDLNRQTIPEFKQAPINENKQRNYSYPKEIILKIKSRDSLYRQIDYLKPLLDHTAPGEELFKIAFEILTIHQKIRELWAEIEHYNEHGFLLEPKPVKLPTVKVINLKQEQLNLRTNISKTKAKLQKATVEEKKNFYKNKLHLLEQELQSVTFKMGKDAF